jgi:hypothetical protein
MSQDFAKDIDAKVRQLTDERKYKAEDIFNLGVQLGRHLEKEKLADVRLSYFAEFDEKTQLRSEFGQLHKSVCDWLERLVRMSIKEQISESKFRDWSIGFNRLYGNNGEFDASIVEKRYVQFKSVRRGDGEHFIAFFEVQGKLKNLFEKHNQPTEFEIIVDNDDGDDYVSISKEEQIDSLYGCMISYNCELDREGVAGYSKFVNELEKSLLLILLQ